MLPTEARFPAIRGAEPLELSAAVRRAILPLGARTMSDVRESRELTGLAKP